MSRVSPKDRPPPKKSAVNPKILHYYRCTVCDFRWPSFQYADTLPCSICQSEARRYGLEIVGDGPIPPETDDQPAPE